MKSFSPDEVDQFNRAPYAKFLRLSGAEDNRIIFKQHQETYAAQPVSILSAANPLTVSMLQLWKIYSGNQELGFLVEVPNLICHVGSNYITVRRRTVKLASLPVLTLRVNKFTVLEVPDESVCLISDNTGNFQT